MLLGFNNSLGILIVVLLIITIVSLELFTISVPKPVFSYNSNDINADRHVGTSLLSVFLLLGVFGSQNVFSAINANVHASRVSGVAPLAVFFDATGTTSTATNRPFHEVHYEWDFGDPTAGRWQFGNQNNTDKNIEFGPVASHVFESPGTYRVTLTTADTEGSTDTDRVTITVSDPSVVFAGRNTLCFSISGDFTGCPSGAQRITTSNFQVAMSNAAAGRRLLFRRGETWVADGESRISNKGPGLIGSFGSGAKPIVASTYNGNLIQFSGSRSGYTTDWRIMDIEFKGSADSRVMVDSENTIKDLLLLRLTGRDFYRFSEISSNTVHHYGSAIHENVFFVECDFADSRSQGVYLAAESVVFMGNYLRNAPNSHVLRITYANPAVIAHNRFAGLTSSSGHIIKFHSFSRGVDDNYAHSHNSSGQFVVSDNVIEHGSKGSWAVALGPQSANGYRPENVRTGIIERNHFVAGPNTRRLLMLWASDVTIRNNLFDQGGAVAAQVSRRNREDPPHDNNIYNNTMYSGETGSSVNAVIIDSIATNTTARNNLLYTRNGSGAVVTGPAQSEANMVRSDLPEGSSNRFQPSGAAVDGGVTVPVFDDYENRPRPQGGAFDVGAYEQLPNTTQLPAPTY